MKITKSMASLDETVFSAIKKSKDGLSFADVLTEARETLTKAGRLDVALSIGRLMRNKAVSGTPEGAFYVYRKVERN